MQIFSHSQFVEVNSPLVKRGDRISMRIMRIHIHASKQNQGPLHTPLSLVPNIKRWLVPTLQANSDRGPPCPKKQRWPRPIHLDSKLNALLVGIEFNLDRST